MATHVVYNDIKLDQVRIHDYQVDNVAGLDNPASSTLRHKMSGEALVFADDDHTSSDFVNALRGRLNVPRKKLLVFISGDTGPYTNSNIYAYPANSFVMADYTQATTTTTLPPCELNGPFFRAVVSQITGTKAVLVNFSIEWGKSYDASGNNLANMVRSFQCVSSFTVDETGRTTIRKRGSLQLKAISDWNYSTSVASRHSINGNPQTPQNYQPLPAVRDDIIVDFVLGSNSGGAGVFQGPDYYRRYISGNLPRGFRRMRQEYAVDESRLRVMFDILDEESFRGLPAPARVGNCQYTFERGLDQGNAIGIKHFIASVKGDSEVTPGALLNLCIRLSQNRIDFVNDLITKIRVTEENMLSENAITFEIMATATSIVNYTPGNTEGSQEGGTTTLVPDQKSLFLKNILSSIPIAGSSFQFSEAEMPDAYGRCQLLRVTPGAYDSQDSIAGKSTIKIGTSDPVVYLFPDSVFDSYADQVDDGRFRYIKVDREQTPSGPQKGDTKKAGEENNKPTYNPQSHQRREIRTGIVDVPAVSFKGGSVPFQVHAPVVEIHEQIEGSKKNEPPLRQFGDRPVTGVVIGETMGVTGGRPDLNGNRVLTAQWNRHIVQRCPGDLPTTPGSSPTDASFKTVSRTVDGQTVILAEYFPTSISMPPEPNQGSAMGYTPPNYTAGLGTNEGYA